MRMMSKLWQKRYYLNKDALVGEQISCPACGCKMTKRTYQHSNKGQGNCKDRFWGRVR